MHVETNAVDASAPANDASEVLPANAIAPRAAEVQLKLLVDPDRRNDLNNAPTITANARNKGTRKHLRSIYYDTPDRMLWRNGLSLRVRQSGARFVQTVKAEAKDDSLRRGAWEAAVASMAPDLALAMPLIPAKLRAELQSCKLEAVFAADVHRHQRLIDLPSGTVEVAFDQGVLKAGDRSKQVSEIVLDLKGGSADSVYEVALRLAEHAPVRPSIRSKAALGFEFADDASPPAVRKPRRIRLDPSTPLDDAFALVLGACFHHLLRSLPAAEDGRHPEGIHQLRVSLRRLRSAFDLMGAVGSLSRLQALRSEAKWLARNLSSARDWDIFRTSTLPTVASACQSIAGFDALSDATEKQRTAAYGNVRFVLDDRRCASFIIALGGWIESRGWRNDVEPEALRQLSEPTIDFASRVLEGQYARVLKRGRHFKSQSAEERHGLRLAVKKLRYHADFLLPLYEQRKCARRFSERLADLQEELGNYNDIVTTASLLGQLGVTSPDGFAASAAVTGWQAHAMIAAERRLREAWTDFTRAKPPWLKQAETRAQ